MPLCIIIMHFDFRSIQKELDNKAAPLSFFPPFNTGFFTVITVQKSANFVDLCFIIIESYYGHFSNILISDDWLKIDRKEYNRSFYFKSR